MSPYNYIHLIPHPAYEFNLSNYIRPSGITREWFGPHFYHCLPLGMANSLGWTIYTPYRFSVHWGGLNTLESLRVETSAENWPVSWFGYGIFTVIPRFFVKTSPGVNLLIKSVPNYYKRGVVPLEGFIETDWFQGGFTLNFKVVEPNIEITFEAGDPLAQMVVYPRHYIDNFEAQIVSSGSEYDEFSENLEKWAQKRRETIDNFTGSNRDFSYMRGEDLDGVKFPDHQKGLDLSKFHTTMK